MFNLLYSLIITFALLCYRQSKSWIWIVFLIIILFIALSKRAYWKIFWGIIFGLILNPHLNQLASKQELIKGVVIWSSDYNFIVKTNHEKVLAKSRLRPQEKQQIILKGQYQPWIKKNFYSFDAKSYWQRKGINYQLKNIKILNNYYQKPRLNSVLHSWFKLVFQNQKDHYNYKIYNTMQELGLAHIVVISSFHIGMLFSLVKKLFYNNLLTWLLILAFCYYINFPLPALKAFIFITLVILFPQINKMDALVITAYMILFFNPKEVTSLSFIFTIGFSIFLFLMPQNISKFKKIMGLKTLGALIQWYFTGAIYLLNYVAIFLAPIILIIYVAILVRWTWLLVFIEKILVSINSYNVAFVIGYLPWLTLVFFVIICWLLHHYWLFQLKAKFAFTTLLLALVFTKHYKNYQNFITFINVGQGDAILIKVNHQNYLVDVGKPNQFSKTIKPYMFKEGIAHLDKLYITHNHYDHNGGLKDSWKGIKIKNKSFYLQNLNNKKWQKENNNSLVLLLNYANKKILLTGDIEKEVENYLIDHYQTKIDILKIAHHGSKTSTSERFLKHFQPQIAIISVGNNTYGHPHPSVLARLKKYNVKVYITQLHGAIKYDFNAKKLTHSHVL